MLPSVEKVSIDAGASLRVDAFSTRAFYFDWHVHPELELTLIESGAGQRFVGESIEAFEPGEVVLLGPGVPHSWRGEVAGPRCSATVVQFRQDGLGERFFELPEMSAVRAMLALSSRGLVFDDVAVASKLRRLPRRSLGFRLPAFVELLVMLSGLEARCLCDRPANRGLREEQRARIDCACRLLQERYLEAVSLDDVASAVGMTPAAACRLFARSTGRTVVAYLHELRVAHACRLLAEGDASVTEVAYASGFGNLAHFNLIFKRLRGVAPRAFRKALVER